MVQPLPSVPGSFLHFRFLSPRASSPGCPGSRGPRGRFHMGSGGVSRDGHPAKASVAQCPSQTPFNPHSNARICVREARRVRSKNNRNWQRVHRARCHKRCRPDGAEAKRPWRPLGKERGQESRRATRPHLPDHRHSTPDQQQQSTLPTVSPQPTAKTP